MIGVSNQYVFIFSTGEFKDFLDEEDLLSFTLIEEAGNVLPTFELVFNTTKKEILKVLNEGNNITISFSKDLSDSDRVGADYVITKTIISKAGLNKYKIVLTGLLSILSYTATGRVRIFKNTTSIAVLKEVFERYFSTNSIKTNFSITRDRQDWVQHGITDKTFVNNVWMHSHLNDRSFLNIGITSDGLCFIKDMKKAANPNGTELFFTTSKTEDRHIIFEGDYVVQSNTAMLNHLIGYGRQKHVFDLENGTESDLLEESRILLAQVKNLPRNASITQRLDQVGMLNDNVHKKYWKSFLRNLQSLITLSNTSVTLTFSSSFEKIRVLDLVQFKDSEINETVSSNENISGLYFVSKVVRTLSNRNLVTTVVLNRESLSEMLGDLR